MTQRLGELGQIQWRFNGALEQAWEKEKHEMFVGNKEDLIAITLPLILCLLASGLIPNIRDQFCKQLQTVLETLRSNLASHVSPISPCCLWLWTVYGT